jgi:hypothetical protein
LALDTLVSRGRLVPPTIAADQLRRLAAEEPLAPRAVPRNPWGLAEVIGSITAKITGIIAWTRYGTARGGATHL